ncbi:Superoxide dismutase [gamma proteobacterium IMCC2047]|nr:Superoxide dismutase [gamma proteobacterium IMCC2047]
MEFKLPPLPYDDSALEPHIGASTLQYHYGKHHQGYMNKLKDALEGTADAEKSLEEIIKAPPSAGVFNLAAQVWNHSFYWDCMCPNGGGEPSATLKSALEKSFGSLEKFYEEFSNAAATQFGSGWAWLVKDGDKLCVVKTGNAETPLTDGVTPLLTIDVWEHAYYLDYQNDRPKYIDTFLKHLVNWSFVESNLG